MGMESFRRVGHGASRERHTRRFTVSDGMPRYLLGVSTILGVYNSTEGQGFPPIFPSDFPNFSPRTVLCADSPPVPVGADFLAAVCLSCML